MIEKGVVNILNTSEVSIGTGYFVRSNLIMTCGHVVKGKTNKADTTSQKEYVNYSAYDGIIRKAEVLDSIPINYTVEGKQESIMILKTETPSDTYYCFCKRNIEGSIVYSFGYPLGLSEQKPAKDIKIDSQNDNSLYLGNSNSVALGCSGAPLLYSNTYLSPEPVVVGMIAKVFKDTDNNKLLGDSSAISAEEIISKAGKYIESIPETFLVADREVDNKFVYNYKNRIPLIGRNKELIDLNDFCNAEKGQVWWAMVAEGGAGKSRLALELAERKQKEGWDVFFITRNLDSHLKNILDNDTYDTLIIVDYILTAGNKLSVFLNELYECIDRRKHKVKVLIIERLAQKGIIQPMLSSDANMINSLKYREYKSENGDEGYLELPRLSDSQLKSLIAKHAGIDSNHSDIKELYRVLKEIDPDNERPLYAMFIADAYKDDKEHPLDWDRNDALEYVCNHEEKTWFKSLNLDPREQKFFRKIVAYVTFIQGAEYRYVKEKCLDEMNALGNYDSFLKSKFESAGLVTYDGMKETDYFIPLRPDLVGEYYVLRYFKNNQRELKGFFDVDWKNCGEGVSSFLASAIHDYPAEIENLKIHDLLLRVPATNLDNYTAKYYLNVLCSILHSAYCIDFKNKVLTYIDNLLSDLENDRQLIVQYARELSNLRNDQIEEISLFIEKLETLIKRYKEDQEIAIYYGFGLVYLIQKQTVEEKATESVEKLEELSKQYKDNLDFTVCFAIGLTQLSEKQAEKEAAISVTKLENLNRQYGNDQYIATQYAKGLAYLCQKQTKEAASISVEKLEDLKRRYEDNQDIAFCYASGLFDLSRKQTIETAIVPVKKLETLSRRYENDRYIAEFYAGGLANLSQKQTGKVATVLVEKLKDLYKRYADDQNIAVQYAKALANLCQKQTVEATTVSVSVEELEALSRRYEDDQNIALLYAASLAELSSLQTVEEATESVEKLEDLSKRYEDDQEIALSYAKGLADLIQNQTAEAATKSVEKLGALMTRYEDNLNIVEWYATGLAELSSLQTVEDATGSVEKLETLSRRYEDDQNIAALYATGLAILSQKQPVEEATESVEKLEDLSKRYEDDQEIALSYAKGLADLSKKQPVEEATESVEKLEALSRRYEDDQNIAELYATGLANLCRKQAVESAALSVEKLEALSRRYKDNQDVAEWYATGLAILSQKQQVEETIVTVEKLENLCRRFEEKQEFAKYYAKGLADLSQKQQVEETIVTVEKLENLCRRYEDDQDIALLYAHGLVKLSEMQTVEAATESVEKLEVLSSRFKDNQVIATLYAIGLANLSLEQNEKGAAKSVAKLEDLNTYYEDNQNIAKWYAVGLAYLSEKQTVEEATVTLEKLECLSRQYEDDQDITEFYAIVLDNLS